MKKTQEERTVPQRGGIPESECRRTMMGNLVAQAIDDWHIVAATHIGLLVYLFETRRDVSEWIFKNVYNGTWRLHEVERDIKFAFENHRDPIR